MAGSSNLAPRTDLLTTIYSKRAGFRTLANGRKTISCGRERPCLQPYRSAKPAILPTQLGNFVWRRNLTWSVLSNECAASYLCAKRELDFLGARNTNSGWEMP